MCVVCMWSVYGTCVVFRVVWVYGVFVSGVCVMWVCGVDVWCV